MNLNVASNINRNYLDTKKGNSNQQVNFLMRSINARSDLVNPHPSSDAHPTTPDSFQPNGNASSHSSLDAIGKSITGLANPDSYQVSEQGNFALPGPGRLPGGLSTLNSRDVVVNRDLYSTQIDGNKFQLAFHESVNDLGCKLLLLYHDINCVFSPFSLAYLLGILYISAEEGTKKELSQRFGFSNKLALAEQLIYFNNFYTPQNKKEEAQLNCHIFYSPESSISSKMGNIIQKMTTLIPVTLPDNLSMINELIEEESDYIISDLIPQNSVTPQTNIILATTFSITPTWEVGFSPSETESQQFQQISGATKVVDMMHHTAEHLYYEDQVCQILEIESNDENLSLGIILPRSGGMKLNSLLSMHQIKVYINNMKPSQVNVKIPKFTHFNKIDLVETLTKMEIRDVFSEYCNLSHLISSNKEGVSKVFHGVVVTIWEKGDTIAKPQNGGINFHADHSFIYYLRDKFNDMLVVMGIFD